MISLSVMFFWGLPMPMQPAPQARTTRRARCTARDFIIVFSGLFAKHNAFRARGIAFCRAPRRHCRGRAFFCRRVIFLQLRGQMGVGRGTEPVSALFDKSGVPVPAVARAGFCLNLGRRGRKKLALRRSWNYNSMFYIILWRECRYGTCTVRTVCHCDRLRREHHHHGRSVC